jgi:hypothetical protein
MIKLLWADDDSVGMLEPLGRKLSRTGAFIVISANSYQDAEAHLTKHSEGSSEEQFQALLLDTILPNSSGGVLEIYSLGLRLAHRAAELGVRSIAFLTVVRLNEIWDDYTALQAAFPKVSWHYFDKLSLLEPGTIDVIMASLKKVEN